MRKILFPKQYEKGNDRQEITVLCCEFMNIMMKMFAFRVYCKN